MKNLYFFNHLFFMQSCAQKVAVLNPANNQIISLSTLYTWSGCKEVTENGVTKVKCIGGRTFRSSRERWWFIAISRCDTGTTVSTCTNTHVDRPREPRSNSWSWNIRCFSNVMFGTKVAHNPKVYCNCRPFDQVQGHVIINIILNNKNFIRSTSIRRYMLIPLGSLKFISLVYYMIQKFISLFMTCL